MTWKCHKTKRSEGPFTLSKQHTPVGTKSQLLSALEDNYYFHFNLMQMWMSFEKVAKWFQNSLLWSSTCQTSLEPSSCSVLCWPCISTSVFTELRNALKKGIFWNGALLCVDLRWSPRAVDSRFFQDKETQASLSTPAGFYMPALQWHGSLREAWVTLIAKLAQCLPLTPGPWAHSTIPSRAPPGTPPGHSRARPHFLRPGLLRILVCVLSGKHPSPIPL